MRRLVLIVALITGSAVQAQGPHFVKNALNGLAWRTLAPAEKTLYLTGATEALYMAYQMQMAQADLNCVRGVVSAASIWFKGSLPELRREMNTFYDSADNVPIPVMNAIVHSQMKLAGTSELELDRYRAASLEAVVN